MKGTSWVAAALVAVGVVLGGGVAAAGPKLPCDGVEDCKRKCGKRDGASCERLAVFDATEEEYLAALERACSGKHAPACVTLGRRIERGHEADRFTRAASLFEKACKAGEQAGCVRLGRLLELGVGGVAKDPERAAKLFRAGCDAGHEASCVALAWAVAKGTGGAADPAEARKRLEQACEAGNAAACGEYGEALKIGRGNWGWAKDVTKAQALRERGCELGHAETCEKLALDAAVAKDEPREARFRGLLCQAGLNPGHCLRAGAKTPKEDVQGKLRWYALGCELGEPSCCSQGAFLLRHGGKEAVEDAGPRARGLTERACVLGSTYACVELAEDLIDGRGGPADPKAGMAQLGKLCKAKQGEACERLAGALERGAGGKPDLRGAAAMYVKLCPNLDADDGYGMSPACEGRFRHEGLKAAAALAGKCDKGDAQSCFEAGRLANRFYQRFPEQLGASWRDNPGLAYERACQLGLGEACVWVADWWSGPERGEAADGGKARAAMARGCDLGHLDACRYLAGWLLDGKHGPPDVARGRAMLEEGCQQGRDADCGALVRWLVEGKDPALREGRRGLEIAAEACARTKGAQSCGWSKRAPEVTALLDQEEACAAGDGAACLGRAKKTKPYQKADRLRLLQLACDAGNAEGCEALAAERAKEAGK